MLFLSFSQSLRPVPKVNQINLICILQVWNKFVYSALKIGNYEEFRVWDSKAKNESMFFISFAGQI